MIEEIITVLAGLLKIKININVNLQPINISIVINAYKDEEFGNESELNEFSPVHCEKIGFIERVINKTFCVDYIQNKECSSNDFRIEDYCNNDFDSDCDSNVSNNNVNNNSQINQSKGNNISKNTNVNVEGNNICSSKRLPPIKRETRINPYLNYKII